MLREDSRFLTETILVVDIQEAGNVPAVKAMLAKANAILGYDLLELCQSGPKERLDDTAFAQPALYVAGLAAVEKLRAEDAAAVDNCAACAGLSLGEYCALAFAGVISFEDGLKVGPNHDQTLDVTKSLASFQPPCILHMSSLIGAIQPSREMLLILLEGVVFSWFPGDKTELHTTAACTAQAQSMTGGMAVLRTTLGLNSASQHGQGDELAACGAGGEGPRRGHVGGGEARQAARHAVRHRPRGRGAAGGVRQGPRKTGRRHRVRDRQLPVPDRPRGVGPQGSAGRSPGSFDLFLESVLPAR